jgi:signal transduction histidine kinase
LKGITSRFAALLAAAAVLPLLIYGAVSIYSLRDGTRQSVVSGNLNVATRAAEQIQFYIEANVKILEAVASDLEGTDLEPWQQDRILKNYVLEFPEFRELTLYDATGTAVATSRVGKSALQIPQSGIALGPGITMSPMAVDGDLLPTSIVGIRLTHAGRSSGWLAGEISLEEMWRMVDRIRVGQRGFALVVASDGRLIAHGDPNQKPRVARGDNLRDHPLVRLTQQTGNREPVWREFDGTGGAAVLGVASPLALLGWTVIVEQPLSEAYAVADQLQRQLVLVIGLALLVMVTIGYFWGRSFIRPIFTLMRGTRAIADGHLDERVRIESKDEFRQLGDAFNTMADRLVELQEDVRKKERQAMFGRMAVGLVHDLSHPIQNIGNSCKLIVRVFDDAEYRETFKRTVERELDTLKRVLDDLRNVARPMPVDRFPVDVNRSVAEVIESMRSAADEGGLSLGCKLASEPLIVEGDVFAMGRVYRNLITNAIQATQPGGRVSVSTVRAGDRVEIVVADTGSGIPQERLGAIFDDFVTTKKRGLGLGLAISKRIVEQLDGTISVASEVGKGTAFTMRFPLAAQASEVAAAG